MRIVGTLKKVYATNKDLANDSFWALFGSVVGKGLSLAAGILIARYLGKEVYGEYGVIKNTLTYIAIVSTFGFGYSATKYVAEYVKSNDYRIASLCKSIEMITILFSVTLSLLCTLFAGEVASVIKAPHLEFPLRVFSCLILFNALDATQIGILSGLKKFKATADLSCVSGVSLFVLSWIGTSVWGLNGAVAALLGSFIIQALVGQVMIRRSVSALPVDKGGSIERKELAGMLSFSLPIALQESLYAVVHWLGLLVLTTYASYGEVGLFSAAGTWFSVVIFIPGVLRNVMFSHLTSADNHHSLLKKLIAVNLVSTIAPVVVLVLASPFITQFYGPTFSDLPRVLNVYMCAALFVCMSEVYCYEYISIGKPWTVFLSRFIRDCFILAMSWILIKSAESNQACLMAVASLCGNALFLAVLMCFYYLDLRKKQVISHE